MDQRGGRRGRGASRAATARGIKTRGRGATTSPSQTPSSSTPEPVAAKTSISKPTNPISPSTSLEEHKPQELKQDQSQIKTQIESKKPQEVPLEDKSQSRPIAKSQQTIQNPVDKAQQNIEKPGAKAQHNIETSPAKTQKNIENPGAKAQQNIEASPAKTQQNIENPATKTQKNIEDPAPKPQIKIQNPVAKSQQNIENPPLDKPQIKIETPAAKTEEPKNVKKGENKEIEPKVKKAYNFEDLELGPPINEEPIRKSYSPVLGKREKEIVGAKPIVEQKSKVPESKNFPMSHPHRPLQSIPSQSEVLLDRREDENSLKVPLELEAGQVSKVPDGEKESVRKKSFVSPNPNPTEEPPRIRISTSRGPGGDERVRRISIGIGGVPKRGYWGGMDDSSDSDDSLIAHSTSKKRPSVLLLGPTLMGYNKRQWLILVVFALVDFCSAVLISIQPPIYPREAEAKGVPPLVYGILFGVFELTIFIMSPIFFSVIHRVNAKAMFNVGIFTTGISAILFSQIDRLDNSETILFVAFSFILRIIEAIGDAACITAAYTIINLEFPDTVGTTFVSLEAFLGLGFIIGPPLSGFLYQANGFMLPFITFGVLLIGSGIMSLIVMPKLKEDTKTSELGKPAFLSLLHIPSVALASASILIASISIGFLNCTLYAHLSQFMLSAPTVGAIFILNHGMYSLSAPIWNIFINKNTDPKYISLIATFLIFIAFLFIGPVGFIPFPTHLEVTCVAIALGGVALGGILVSAFIVIMKDTVDYGFPDNEATFGLSTGLYTSIFTLGSFFGLSASGILYDTVGFRWGSIFPLSIHVLLALSTVIFIIFGKSINLRSQNNASELHGEKTPLLMRKSNDEKGDRGEDKGESGPEQSSPPSKKVDSSYGGTSTSYESLA